MNSGWMRVFPSDVARIRNKYPGNELKDAERVRLAMDKLDSLEAELRRLDRMFERKMNTKNIWR